MRANPDALLTRAQAALLAGVTGHAVSMWDSRGLLPVAGHNRRGQRLYRYADVCAADARTRTTPQGRPRTAA